MPQDALGKRRAGWIPGAPGLLTTLIGGPVMLWVASGIPLTGAATAIFDAGPLPFFVVNAALAAAFAVLCRIRARRLGLPAWRDL